MVTASHCIVEPAISIENIVSILFPFSLPLELSANTFYSLRVLGVFWFVVVLFCFK